MLTVIGIEKMEEVSKFFSVFFFVFFDPKKSRYETPTVFSVSLCNDLRFMLMRVDATERLSQDGTLLYTLCTALIQSNTLFLLILHCY
jgi:hypothetical protein